MKNIEQINTDCMIQHFKKFYEQSVNCELADFGEPCSTCPYLQECGCNWYQNIQPLLENSRIEVEFPLPNQDWKK